MGTPLYMSPEQVEGKPVDARSDIYSLGVSCYHLLAGVPPHTGDTALAIAVQHLHNTPEPLENVRPDLPSALARIVHKMLAKKPAARPASPSDLLIELRELATVAAQEGWAAGPDDWSLAEWIATEPARSRKSEELDQVMQAEARLMPAGRNWLRLAFGLAAAILLGLLLGAISRPKFYLASGFRTPDEIPQLSSAWAQLYHAQMSSSEAAWQKAIEFPEDDPFVQELAKRGLVRYYLLVTEDYRAALPELRKLEQQSQANKRPSLLHAFSLAGLCISYENMGRETEARAAQAKLDPGMRDHLRELEPQIHRLLQASLGRLGG